MQQIEVCVVIAKMATLRDLLKVISILPCYWKIDLLL